jgi:predicted phosphodiesterase
MANINHKWKRLLAIPCTHARYCDKEAWANALKFKERFKPTMVLHLGDFIDLTALLGNGEGSGSEGEEITPDIDTGLQHLRELRPNVVLCGNHEDRAWKLSYSKNAVKAYCAHKIVNAIEETTKKIGAKLVPYTGIKQKYNVADCVFTHGTEYGEQAAKNMAMRYTNGITRKVVFAHTHKVAIASAPTDHGGTAYNIGCLVDPFSLEYAKSRSSTFQWTQAFLWGEYCEELNQSSLQITQRAQGEVWRLPI